MSVIPPVCQLLQRQDSERYVDWLRVAAPYEAAKAVDDVARYWVTDITIAQAFIERGQNVHLGIEPPDEAPKGVLLFWPKSHALGTWWLEKLCQWLPEGTPIDLVGEHHGGIKRVPKVLEAAGMACTRIDNARRCSLFTTKSQVVTELSEGWSDYQEEGITLATHPGVFAHGRLDQGTALLLDILSKEFANRRPVTALDAGCGDGIISVWLAKKGINVSALDADAFAVEATRRSLALNDLQGDVNLHDMLDGVKGNFDAIISNPPFHQARDVDYGPAHRLITDAASHLSPGGKLYIVANSFLPYRAPLEAVFNQVDTLEENGRYRVYRASSPKR